MAHQDRAVAGSGHVLPITITATGSTDDPTWSCAWPHWDGATRTFTFDKRHYQGMKKDDYHLIEFKLDDQTAPGGLTFPKDPDDAMWVMAVQAGTKPRCPGKNDSCNYAIFRPLARLEPTRYLVLNRNPAVEQWTFTLNFVKPGCSETDRDSFVPFDPIGDNKDAASLA